MVRAKRHLHEPRILQRLERARGGKRCRQHKGRVARLDVTHVEVGAARHGPRLRKREGHLGGTLRRLKLVKALTWVRKKRTSWATSRARRPPLGIWEQGRALTGLEERALDGARPLDTGLSTHLDERVERPPGTRRQPASGLHSDHLRLGTRGLSCHAAVKGQHRQSRYRRKQHERGQRDCLAARCTRGKLGVGW